MSGKVKLPEVCFIGCGNIAARHAGMLRKLYPEIALAFADAEPSRAREYAARFGKGRSFDTVDAALSSADVNIAFLTTPHAYHAGLAVLAAKHGKDMIIEKPIARSMKELATIERAVAKSGVRCAVAENYLYKPIIPKIRSYVERGIIGEPLVIELNKTNRDTVAGWRTDAKMMGGGALLEGGVHWVNALVSLAASRPLRVMALKPTVAYETSVPFEDTIMVTVKFENGMAGKLLHSWRLFNPLKGMSLSKIYGTDGVITFESNGLFCSAHGRKIRLAAVNPMDFLGFRAMHRAFIEDYLAEKPWRPDLARIHMEMSVVDAAYRSLKSERFEAV